MDGQDQIALLCATRRVRAVAPRLGRAYLAAMSQTPAFLDRRRPPVPDIVVPRGVTPFFLPRRPVRGRLVRLGPLADALLTRHDNHPVVTRLAGQALALAAALSGALKFRGSFSLQAKGDGPVPMLLADCTDTGALRGYARADADGWTRCWPPTPSPAAPTLLGGGYLAFTVDQGPDTEPPPGHRRDRGRKTSPRWRCTISAPASNCAAWSTSPANPPRPAGARAP